jgi:hypothetical protein
MFVWGVEVIDFAELFVIKLLIYYTARALDFVLLLFFDFVIGVI